MEHAFAAEATPAAPAAVARAEPQPALQYLRFAIGTESYAVRVESVREILELMPMTPLPLVPAFVRGVMNLRGVVVPVLDLGARLGLQATVVGRRSCVVIVDVPVDGGAPMTLGMLVDGVHEVFDFRAGECEPVPRMGTRVDPRFVRCITRARGLVTPELNLEAVLELQALSGLIAAHQSAHQGAHSPGH
ncbi:MAG: chemotaxis protein CheW [Burkholderiaceae bacterium]